MANCLPAGVAAVAVEVVVAASTGPDGLGAWAAAKNKRRLGEGETTDEADSVSHVTHRKVAKATASVGISDDCVDNMGRECTISV